MAAGIDTALWDLMVRREGVSVAVLGGKLDTVDLYAFSMQRSLPVQEEADRLRASGSVRLPRSKAASGYPGGTQRRFLPQPDGNTITAMAKTAAPGTHLFHLFRQQKR